MLPGGNGRPFDWRLARDFAPEQPVAAVGRARRRTTSARRSRFRARAASTSRRASRARRASRTRTKSRPSSPPRAPPSRASTRQGAPRDQSRQAQFVPQRPRRARPFRHFRRPLRRRDADAADPVAGAGLRARPRTIPNSTRARRSAEPLRRPAEPALFRRAADRASRRREDLFQARRAQSHRRAQDQQRARPDPARAPHGQDAHHRRDRRRPARRRHRHRLRALRPEMRRLHGRGRHRAAEAQRLPHEDARRRGARRCSRARARSRTR